MSSELAFVVFIASCLMVTVGGYLGGRWKRRRLGGTLYLVCAFLPLFFVVLDIIKRHDDYSPGVQMSLWQGAVYAVVFGTPASMALATAGYVAGNVVRRRKNNVI